MAFLETRRLIIREMRRSDVENLHVLFSDPLFIRFWPVFDRSRTEQWVEDSLLRFESFTGKNRHNMLHSPIGTLSFTDPV